MTQQFKFDVQITDFSARGLPAKDANGTSDPYLKLDFDNFKIIKTEKESKTLNPSWGLAKRFTYRTRYLDKLSKKKFKIQCYDHNFMGADAFIGEASIDLLTLCTGPRNITLTLMDGPNSAGQISFICVMKMLSELRLTLKDVVLTFGGNPHGAQLQVFPSLDETNQIALNYSETGTWAESTVLVFETSIWDLVGPSQDEFLRIQVIDRNSALEGEALLAFSQYFRLQGSEPVPFKVPVSTGGHVSPVGEVSGVLVYDNQPTYAQLAGGMCQDRNISGGYLIYPGLPLPPNVTTPPALLPARTQEQHTAPPDQQTHALAPPTTGGGGGGASPPVAHAATQMVTPSQQLHWEYMDDIALPPDWEMRKDRRTGRPYFADHRSRRTCWTDPRFLPENWDQRIDPQTGRVYYAYHKTKKTSFIDPRGCPHGWEARLTTTSNMYFAYHPTKQTTFTDPRGLPENVTPALDNQGRLYFKNHINKSTQWEDPRYGRDDSVLQLWRDNERLRWWAECKTRFYEEMRKEAEEQNLREE